MQTKIKILHIQETIGSGGVERRRLSLAKHLDKNLFEQKFVCTYAFGNIPEEIRAEGFEVIPIGQLKSPFDWKQHKKVQKIIEDYQPDIIHGAVFEGVTMAAINGWIKKVPVIIIEETSFPMNRSWKANLLMKLFALIADKIIGVSQAVTDEYLRSVLKLPTNKIILINNGVALPRELSQKELINNFDKWEITQKDFVVGSIGRMEDDSLKRYSDLIKGFTMFSKGKKNVKLLLVGGNNILLKQYIDLAKILKISDKVVFAGYQEDVTIYYKSMNVFALVSIRESFGLSLAEAMLNRLPSVVTKVGGMKYIIENEKTGYFVDIKSPNQIAEKLQILYDNPKLRSEMGQKAYEKALSNFTERSYVQKVSDLYQQMYCPKQ